MFIHHIHTHTRESWPSAIPPAHGCWQEQLRSLRQTDEIFITISSNFLRHLQDNLWPACQPWRDNMLNMKWSFPGTGVIIKRGAKNDVCAVRERCELWKGQTGITAGAERVKKKVNDSACDVTAYILSIFSIDINWYLPVCEHLFQNEGIYLVSGALQTASMKERAGKITRWLSNRTSP